MKSKPAQHSLTDRDGDRASFWVVHDGRIFVTVSTEGTACTAGGFTRPQLVEALDAVAPDGTGTCPDLDAHWRLDEAMDRAERAERERDEWKDSAIKAMADLERAEQPRPLTPRQNLAALWESAHRPVGGRIPAGTAIITRSDHGSGDVRYQTLEATGRDLPDPGYTLERNYNYGPENGEEYRLLDPPARPEGAEDVAVRLFQAGAAVGVEMTTEQRDALADHLAHMGFRVPVALAEVGLTEKNGDPR